MSFTQEHKNKLKTRRKGKKPTLGKHWKIKDTSKMSKSKIGKKRKPFSKEWIKNMSKGRMGKCIGKKHWNYKGGVSKNKDYVSWSKNKRNRMPKIGNHTWGEWELLKKQYGFMCPCCGKSEPEIKLTQDHIIPLSRGGSDYIENIQPLCMHCNSVKHTDIIKFNNKQSECISKV